uniref:GRF-type domain-containing protein n=1 Tax=Brassica oleracea var. oleracea TaxID=109376 RepID=A0A0D3AHF0_BRAOL
MDIRGIVTHYRCGEHVRLLTSRTVKNRGRLFHSCPYGDETSRFHLLKWADRSALEEIEDMKVRIDYLEKASSTLEKDNESFNSEVETLTIETRTNEAVVYSSQKELQGFEKELQDCKMEVKGLKNMTDMVKTGE